MKIFKRVMLVVAVLFVWTAFIGYGFIAGFLLRPLTGETSAAAFIAASQERMQEGFVGNVGLVLIEDGEVVEDYYFSADDRVVNEHSLFAVASISKWVTAFGVMKLVEDGKVDLDRPVDDYLTRWHLPVGEYDNAGVTVRRLLSHSSGLVDDLGYAGFGPEERVQTLEESLTKAADGLWSEGVARVGYAPGSGYMYSGAGYTLLQLLIEEVSGMGFEGYMQQEVFGPLGMEHSTFGLDSATRRRLVRLYQDDGSTRAYKRFTALAAASLKTCTADLSRFVLANVGENGVLSGATIGQMAESETYINGVGIYGLGPHLYSQNAKNSRVIGHDGSGNNAINTAARIDVMSKAGIIVLETGSYNLASHVADEWLYWKVGVADFVVMQRNKGYVLRLLVGGYGLILAGAIFLMRRRRGA